MSFDKCFYDVFGQDFIRVFAGWGESIASGHEWLFGGMIRRDVWNIGPLSFGVMRMPKETHEPG